MSNESLPELGPGTVIAIRREGGVAHFPGLAAPRQIHCAECTLGQRRWLAHLLSQAARCRVSGSAAGADRHVFYLSVAEREASDRPDAGWRPLWSLSLAEEQAPQALVTLWQQGRLEEE